MFCFSTKLDLKSTYSGFVSESPLMHLVVLLSYFKLSIFIMRGSFGVLRTKRLNNRICVKKVDKQIEKILWSLKYSLATEKKCKYLNANTKTSVKTKYMFVSTLLCGSKMLNRAFITSTTSAELGFRNRKSTRDDLLLTDFGVRYAETHSCMA